MLRPAAGERTELASSYDRASRYDADSDRYIDWGANADGTGVVRMEGEEAVLAEIEGPGCIWRIWSATVGRGHVRIYLDGAAEPAVDLPFEALFDGKHEPFTRPQLVYQTTAMGYNNYTPIPFQRSCRIVAAKDWGKYYHFNYTRFAPGTAVPTFRRTLSAEDAAALDEADRTLARAGENPGAVPEEARVFQRAMIAWPGRATLAADLDGPRVIRALRVRCKLPEDVEAQRRVLREVAVRITWDGEAKPAVWSPLGDFFGSSAGAVPFRTLPVGLREDGTFYCFWRMPFKSRAEIFVENDGAEPVEMTWEIEHAPLEHAMGDCLRFHAKWHGDVLPVRADRAPDWTLVQTSGIGRFVGTQLHVWNPRGGWWGEGDEKFFVDGEKFPSTFGTGTEDYLGYAWSSGNTFVQALHSQPVNQNNRGHVSANRWHVPDDVPFARSFEAVIEKYFPNENPCEWAAVAYWYLEDGGEDPLGAAPVSERVKAWTWPEIWREKDVFEAEDLPVVKEQWKYAGCVMDAVARNIPAGMVSGDRFMMWWVDAVGYRLELGGLKVERAGRYRVWARFIREHEMGIFRFDLAGQPLAQAVDLFAPTKGGTPVVGDAEMLGEVELTAGEHALGIEVSGKHAESSGYLLAIDYVKLVAIS
jgi:Protein of unknown function (DUF2961).